jgi:hypothetical protein
MVEGEPLQNELWERLIRQHICLVTPVRARTKAAFVARLVLQSHKEEYLIEITWFFKNDLF